jgi:hypothetical protein
MKKVKDSKCSSSARVSAVVLMALDPAQTRLARSTELYMIAPISR